MTEQEPKVYVVQEQMRFDRDSRQMVPRFPSISRATMYGELVYLLSPTAAPFSSESIVKELHFKLKGFTENDHLLLVGNPCLIGWVVSIAAQYNEGRVSLLQWSGKDQNYIPVFADLSPPK